jgi:hypothetical protein
VISASRCPITECHRPLFAEKRTSAKAIQEAPKILRKQTGRHDVSFQGFELYTLRHTCLTRWRRTWTRGEWPHLASHRDMYITKRYAHPQEQTIRGDGSGAWS